MLSVTMQNTSWAFEYREPPLALRSEILAACVSVSSPCALNVQAWPVPPAQCRLTAFATAAPTAQHLSLHSPDGGGDVLAGVYDVSASSAPAAASAAVAAVAAASTNIGTASAANAQPGGNASDFDSDDPDFSDLVSVDSNRIPSGIPQHVHACLLARFLPAKATAGSLPKLANPDVVLVLQSGVEPDWTLDRLRTLSRKVRMWHGEVTASMVRAMQMDCICCK